MEEMLDSKETLFLESESLNNQTNSDRVDCPGNYLDNRKESQTKFVFVEGSSSTLPTTLLTVKV